MAGSSSARARSQRSSLCGLLAVVLASAQAVALPTPARAAPAAAAGEASAEDKEAARAYYKRGEEAFALGKFEEAVGYFEESYRLFRHPDLLFNIGNSYQSLFEISQDPRHLRHARTLFQNYISFVGAEGDLSDDDRREAEAHIAEIDARLAEIEAAEPEPEPGPEVEAEPEPPREGPEQAPPPGAATTDKPEEPEQKPVHKKGWFWAAVVLGTLAVAGGITAAVVLTRPDEIPDPELGTIGQAARLPGSLSVSPGGLTIAF